VLAQIRRLGAAGISVHTQVVACPGLNDGPALQRTIQDLAALYPTVQSIAVVPVGLTRFRFEGKRPKSIRAAIEVHESPDWIDSNWERQPRWAEMAADGIPLLQEPGDARRPPSEEWGFCARLGAATDAPLRCYTPAEATRVIDLVLPYARRYQHDLGVHLVYPSDEFYILCQREVPPADFYDGMPQYSNGVGMTRDFLDGWAKAQRRLPARLRRPARVAIVCGTLIAPILQRAADRLGRVAGLEVRLLPVVNQFFGETVTVSGLLMGQDVVPALRASRCDRAILPRVMFDHQGLRTLDEYSPQRIAEEAGMPVAIAGDADELARYVRGLAQADT
jgi:NifB/MoaA-like Fe-S oxidoreductase